MSVPVTNSSRIVSHTSDRVPATRADLEILRQEAADSLPEKHRNNVGAVNAELALMLASRDVMQGNGWQSAKATEARRATLYFSGLTQHGDESPGAYQDSSGRPDLTTAQIAAIVNGHAGRHPRGEGTPNSSHVVLPDRAKRVVGGVMATLGLATTLFIADALQVNVDTPAEPKNTEAENPTPVVQMD